MAVEFDMDEAGSPHSLAVVHCDGAGCWRVAVQQLAMGAMARKELNWRRRGNE